MLVGVLLAAVFLWLVVRHVSFEDLWAALVAVRPEYLLAAGGAFICGYASRIERWRLMLTHANPGLRWHTCAGPFMASVAANNVLPFRAGDVLRALSFGRELGVSSSATVSSLITERLLDLLMMAVFLGLATATLGAESSTMLGVGGWIIATGGGVFLVLLMLPGVLRRPVSLLVSAIAVVSRPASRRMRDALDSLLASLALNASARTMTRLVLWSFVTWAAEGAVFWFAALSLPSIDVPSAAWAAMPVGTLATVIPSTPGYIGTFDFFAAQTMMTLGNTLLAATSFALLVHLILWVPPTLVGGLYGLYRLAWQPAHRKVLPS